MQKRLYHNCAADLPLIDYHNHLNIDDLAADRNFNNLAELWITNDPYKHRAMRICGVDEKYITGKAEDFDKFKAWMPVLPKLIGNLLYDFITPSKLTSKSLLSSGIFEYFSFLCR